MLHNSLPNVSIGKLPACGLISVVIPVHKDWRGLRETLLSLELQYLDSRQYEIVVVNDGACEEVSATCSQFNVIEVSYSPRRGSYYARNRGLERCSGEFVAFTDADVTVPRDWLSRGRELLKEYDYVGGNVSIDIKKLTKMSHYQDYLSAFPVKQYFHGRGFCVTANLFVKRLVIESLGGFDERLESGGDMVFGVRVTRSDKYTSHFDEALCVLHPPRDLYGQIRKRIRIERGKCQIASLYPEFGSMQSTGGIGISDLLRAILPAKPSAVIRFRLNVGKYSLVQWFFYLWAKKGIETLAVVAFRFKSGLG